jgi:hypothetical protein
MPDKALGFGAALRHRGVRGNSLVTLSRQGKQLVNTRAGTIVQRSKMMDALQQTPYLRRDEVRSGTAVAPHALIDNITGAEP